MPKKVEEIKEALIRKGYSEAQAWAMAYSKFKQIKRKKKK